MVGGGRWAASGGLGADQGVFRHREKAQAAEHGYVDGEGGEQRWRSPALRGSGEDRNMSGGALTAWQRGEWKQVLEVEDMWRRQAGVPMVGEAGEAKA